MKRTILFALTLAAAAAIFDGEALARGGRKDTRVRERVTLVASGFPGRARLEVRRDAPDRQEVRLDAENTTAGQDLRVWIENAQGQMVEVAAMVETRQGRYSWRARTKKGDALPFGQSDVAGLSGRTVEIRTAAGAAAFATSFPVIAPTKAPVVTKRALRTNLAVNRGVATAIGAPDLEARTEVSLRRGGRQRFGVKVENARPGQVFEIWVEDPATGQMVFLSTLSTGASVTQKRGGDSGSDDDTDDDDADDDADEADEEGEVEFDSEDGDDLPVGAADVSDLAGLDVEVRTESGEVVAEGEIAAVGETPRADDDDDDGVEDGEDEDSDDDTDDDTDEDSDDDPPPTVLKR